MSENDVQKVIFEWLIRHNHLAIRINSGAMVTDGKQGLRRFVRFATWQVIGQVATYAGVSDILACCFGRFVAIEVKAPGKKDNVTENQKRFLAAVARCGGMALVAESLDDVSEILELVY